MTLLLERQMKNIWVGVSVPMEHRQTTTDLSAISTEALFQYQIVFFWHTESLHWLHRLRLNLLPGRPIVIKTRSHINELTVMRRIYLRYR